MDDVRVNVSSNGALRFYGWRFARVDGTSSFQTTPQEVGVRYCVPHNGDGSGSTRRIRAMNYGFHAALDPLEALAHAVDWFVERVLLEGDLDVSGDLVAAAHRTCLWRADASALLPAFAADCAERALVFVQNRGGKPTEQTIEAVKAARAVVSGEMSLADMEARFRPLVLTQGLADAECLCERAARNAIVAYRDLCEIDLASINAADAIACTVKPYPQYDKVSRDAIFDAELRRNGRILHARLKTLAPDGYHEPSDGWDWDLAEKAEAIEAATQRLEGEILDA